MSSSPAVLVIGASGAIGSPLINDLGPDHQVGGLRLVAATRKEEAARSLRERGIEMRHLDPEVAETGGLDAIQPASPASTGYSSSAATTYACSSSPRRPSTRRMGRSRVRNYFERIGNGSWKRTVTPSAANGHEAPVGMTANSTHPAVPNRGESMATTVLVTGATGKTARRLIPKLLQRGITVRAGSRTPASARAGAEPVHFDWFDESTYPLALAGAEAVYLVSPQLAGDLADPLAQVQKFAHSAADLGVGRIVLLSSFGVDQALPEDRLRRVELAVAGSGVPHTILRPAAFMQNFSENHWSGVARKIRDQGQLVMPFGEHPVSYVSADDIAEVAAAALTEDGHAGTGYTLTGPESITLTEAATHISAAAGRHVRYADPGPEAIRHALLDSGVPAEFADYVSQAFQFAVTSGAMTVVTGDVLTVTGRPATTFADFAVGAAGAWIA